MTAPSDNQSAATQPYVVAESDMVLVPRAVIEDARRALLYLSAEQVSKSLRAEAERRFFDVHERLGAALKGQS